MSRDCLCFLAAEQSRLARNVTKQWTVVLHDFGLSHYTQNFIHRSTAVQFKKKANTKENLTGTIVNSPL